MLVHHSHREKRNARTLSVSEKLLPTTLIRRHQPDIIRDWLDKVRERIPAARQHGRAELADHLQDLLDDIVHTLQDLGPQADPEHVDRLGFIGTASARHGRERASIENFNAGDLAYEYVLLRHVITGYCSEHMPEDPRSIDIINRVIEFASLAAVNEFVRAIQEIQQKLVGTLVHDVRTPLGVAYNYTEILSLADATPELRDQAVKTIMRNLRRSVTMLEELLDVVKVGAGAGLLMRFEEDDLNKAIRTMCAEASQIYQRPIVPELEDHEVMGVFDMAMVVRTMENLVSNAVKFGDRQGPVRIILEDAGEQVHLKVHNRGNPIPEAEKENIFNFFSSPRLERGGANKGWGLGLSLIKSVAESHGGEVIFSSSAEAGTTFGMTLSKRFRENGEEITMLL